VGVEIVQTEVGIVKPGGHRQAEIGHFGEVGALAAEQVAQTRFALGLAVAEGIDPLAGFYPPQSRASSPRPFFAAVFTAGFAAVLAGAFFNVLRADSGARRLRSGR